MAESAKKALILAAGVGDRLGDEACGRPKCLLEFGGQSLLARHLHSLAEIGVERVVFVLGYRAEMVEAALDKAPQDLDIAIRINPHFTQGSVVSLWTLREELAASEDLLLMDSDVLHHRGLLERLARTAVDNCFLLDRHLEAGDEPVKLCVRHGRIVEFRKRLAPDLVYDFAGESVGFFRFGAAMAARLATRCSHYFHNGRLQAPYEEAIRDLVQEEPQAFGYEDVTGLPWIEIDFPADVTRAADEILPQLEGLP